MIQKHLTRAATLSWLALAAGCSEPAVQSSALNKPPPATDVGRLQAWQDAEHIAARDSGRVAVLGGGESMLPVYGENTVLVLTKIEYENLKSGMQVAYISQAGRRVVHVLLEQDARGWRVQGLNNEVEDAERVTRYNLIGVVYASFVTDEALK